MNNIKQALAALKKGRPILIIDDQNRENEGDLIIACQSLNEASLNFMVKHSSGVICMATTGEQLNRLGLPQIESPLHKRDKQATAFAYSFEASSQIGTGISAKDRAHSLYIAARPEAKAGDIISPGHVFPLRAKDGGLKARQGHTEAAVDICKLANLWPSAAISEVPDENGDMLKGERLEFFAKTYDIPLVSIEEIKEAQKAEAQNVQLEAQSQLPTKFGNFTIQIWKDDVEKEHIALLKGDILDKEDILVRMHSQCLTGDIFASLKCDCQSQLHHGLREIEKEGCGVLLWLPQEGRDIGLTNKIKAYNLQDKGLNTVEANKELGLPIDGRNYKIAASILQQLGVKSIRLMSNNPQKWEALEATFPQKVKHIQSLGEKTKENADYLEVKKTLLGHLL